MRQAEIIDETDVYVDVDNHVKIDGRSKIDLTKLRRLDSAVVDATLTEAEVKAIAQHLGESLKQPADALAALVRRAQRAAAPTERRVDAGRSARSRADRASAARAMLLPVGTIYTRCRLRTCHLRILSHHQKSLKVPVGPKSMIKFLYLFY